MPLKTTILLLLGGITIFFASCSNSESKTNTVETETIKAENTDSLTFYIDQPCLVFIIPDSLELWQMKNDDSTSFYAAMDDYSYYLSQAEVLADSLMIKSFPTTKKLLDFKTIKNEHILIDLSKLKAEDPAWGIYLFNGEEAPQLKSSIDIDKKLLVTYFKLTE